MHSASRGTTAQTEGRDWFSTFEVIELWDSNGKKDSKKHLLSHLNDCIRKPLRALGVGFSSVPMQGRPPHLKQKKFVRKLSRERAVQPKAFSYN